MAKEQNTIQFIIKTNDKMEKQNCILEESSVNGKRVIYVDSNVSGKVLAKAIHEKECAMLRTKWAPIVEQELKHKK